MIIIKFNVFIFVVDTPLGSFQNKKIFKVAGIFNTGFLEFDQNIIFLNIEDALSIFNKEKKIKILEIYLDDPLKANSFKNKIQKDKSKLFYLYLV